jgi:hypothetical protein
MSDTLSRVSELIDQGAVIVSRHGFRELAADDILIADAVGGIRSAEVVEDYPDAWKGPSILTLQYDRNGRPIHVVWGMPKEGRPVAILVTAYRPDSAKWSEDFRRRI